MRILFVTDEIPYPPVSGNLLRTYHLCARIAREHELWLAAPLSNDSENEGVAHMEQFCHTVVTAKRQHLHGAQHLPGLLRYALKGRPWELKFEHCEELFQRIQHLMKTESFDVVHIEPSYMALYLEALDSAEDCKRFLTFHNIESDLYRRQSRITRRTGEKVRTLLHSQMLRFWEPRYAKRFDGCITVSETDRSRLLSANPGLEVGVIPNGVDTHSHQLLPLKTDTPRLLFVGSMSYRPCIDAVLFFANETFPKIRQAVADAEFWIVGRDPVTEVQDLIGNGIYVTGWVDDVRSYYERSAACVVPLRAGGGTRLKILEAMALGRPVVSTSLGCEGLDVVDGETILIADTPDEFAAKTITLLTDSNHRRRIIDHGRKLVEQKYEWDTIAQQLLRLYTRSASEPGRLTGGIRKPQTQGLPS